MSADHARPLEGKIALVTGASRGIGAEIAQRFADAGATVAVTARTVTAGSGALPGSITETTERIEAGGGTAHAFQADLARPEQRESLITEVLAAFGRVDILVNNAAVTYYSQISEFTVKRQALMFEVQVNAPIHLAQLVLPGMRERGQGWILNISSRAALHPQQPYDARDRRGGTVYGMCKAALERFSTGLAAEVFDDGITVNSLAPNKVVPTPGTLFHKLTTNDDPKAEQPRVMAEAALALCTRQPTELTGRVTFSQDLLTELTP